ncbi:fimbrial biogenesis chaperone [Intestinirhabdus alba]|jgi:fimbrial chaperone protein|uniref:Fimbria/pilus periplasmic chaperone n=1 Tax=Intestinirhabdus alba TaxID=2899544 RepID=A0A6L6IHZ0_9ENTR|nr:fimbria/pilus periplasmic chaperone [Intestinirhabdus alba]MTH44700.1 fimbria/pilus periplasmic chaperone [Intestinirhabdus alba]
MKSRFIRVVIFFIGYLTFPAFAASLQMYPVTVNFCHGETARPVYIKNTGTEPIGTQMRLYLWQQKDRKDILTPARELIISPPVASIPPGRQQLVRIIAPAGATGAGQSFRLIVDELPGEQRKVTTSQVNFLLRYSVPVFFTCRAARVDISAIRASLETRGPTTRLIVRNNGAQPIKLSNVSLLTAGKNVVINRGLMGYALPGSEMAWPLPSGIRTGTSLSVTVNDNEINKIIPLTP